MDMFFVLCFLRVVTMLLSFAEAIVENTPNCHHSCSDQVSCHITGIHPNYCGAEHKKGFENGPDFPAAPIDLKVHQFHSEEYQYIHLSWRPPQDGSYNYLTGFLVQVTAIAHNRGNMDVRMCYNIRPASTWFQTHRALIHLGGVVFYMNCLRMHSEADMDMIITIQSLPLKWDGPKLANTTVFIRPESTMDRWNPEIKKWTDASGVLHVVIENPQKNATFYTIQIQSEELARVVFKHMFPATPENTTLDKYVKFTTDGKPHILIYDLKKDKYSILLDALDGNGTQLPHVMSIETNSFSLNFSRESLVTRDRGEYASPVIIVLVLAVIAAAVIAGLVYRGVLRCSRLSPFVGSTPYQPADTRNTAPAFTAIYCYDNDNFGHAVENHISLLHRYINAANHLHNHHTDFSCSNVSWSATKSATELKDYDIIIYLSPRLGEILKFGHRTRPSLSCKDAVCYHALLMLRENSLTGKHVASHLVTFDCFQMSEKEIIGDLLALIFPNKQDVGVTIPTPLRLASFTSESWRLENLEQLLLVLCHQIEFPQDVARCLHGWRESPEANSVIRSLYLLNSNLPDNVGSKPSDQQETSSVPGDFSTSCTESNVNMSSHKPARVFTKTFRKKLKNVKVQDKNVDLTLPLYVPLFSKFSDYRSGSAHLIQGNYSVGVNRSISFSNSSVASYEKNQLSPSESQAVIAEFHLLPQPFENTEDEVSFSQESHDTLKAASKSKDNASPVQFFNTGSPSWIGDLKTQKSSIQNENFHSYQDSGRKRGLGLRKNGYAIIPPSLSQIGCSSTDSVCECINKINDSSNWCDSSQTT